MVFQQIFDTYFYSNSYSSSSAISFTSGIDSTYKEYIFKFINVLPEENVKLKFNLSIDTGGNTNYNQTKTATNFYVDI